MACTRAPCKPGQKIRLCDPKPNGKAQLPSRRLRPELAEDAAGIRASTLQKIEARPSGHIRPMQDPKDQGLEKYVDKVSDGVAKQSPAAKAVRNPVCNLDNFPFSSSAISVMNRHS